MIYLNGKFIKDSEAYIAASDRGFTLGDGLFETLLSHQEKLMAFSQHWERLQKGLKILDISFLLNKSEVEKIIETLLIENQLTKNYASIRITITRGPSKRGLSIDKNAAPTCLIRCFPHTFDCEKTLSVSISDIIRNEHSPLNQFKSLNYLENSLAKQHAEKLGFDDAIFLNSQGAICCGTQANLFFIKKNVLFTPHLQTGALPGITRSLVLKAAKKLNISVHEGFFTVEDLLAAETAFFTNSLIGLQRIHKINNKNLKNNTLIERLLCVLLVNALYSRKF